MGWVALLPLDEFAIITVLSLQSIGRDADLLETLFIGGLEMGGVSFLSGPPNKDLPFVAASGEPPGGRNFFLSRLLGVAASIFRPKKEV